MMPTLDGVEYVIDQESVSVLSADESYQVSDIASESGRTIVVDWTLIGLGGGNFNKVGFIEDHISVFKANQT